MDLKRLYLTSPNYAVPNPDREHLGKPHLTRPCYSYGIMKP
jgi:hypothetical protein